MASGVHAPLLGSGAVAGAVDYLGRPAARSRTGGWRSVCFIIGVETAERIAYYGVGANLISYLTGPLGQSTAAAAANVNAWNGVGTLLPLVGAAVADSFLGRFPTIVVASLVYILGLSLMTISAVLFSYGPVSENRDNDIPRSSFIQATFFLSLYLIAVGQGGHKPCVQAFGADQFDGQDARESKARSSFFNWWYFGMNSGMLFSFTVLFYIQDNINWGLGFGIPCLFMVVALGILLAGRRTYRYEFSVEDRSPLVKIGHEFVSLVRNWRAKATPMAIDEDAESDLRKGVAPTQILKLAYCITSGLSPASLEPGVSPVTASLSLGIGLCGVQLLPFMASLALGSSNIGGFEDAKALLKLFPIWATGLTYAITFAQNSTFFTKQGATMDRSTGIKDFTIPPASLLAFTTLSIMLAIPIYDALLAPISMLQRIGTGMFLSLLSMATAALVESKRLQTALDHGLVDSPGKTIPMAIWWLVPQYVLAGVSDVFAMVGLQELFYSQVPDELRSVGLSLYLSIFGVGSLVSGLVVSAVDDASRSAGGCSWFADNLNRAHLDYFYWMLAGLQFVGLVVFVYFTKSYVYRRKIASL